MTGRISMAAFSLLIAIFTAFAALRTGTLAEAQSKKSFVDVDMKRNPVLDPSKMGENLPINLFVEMAKSVNPSVVSILTARNVRGRGQRDPMADMFDQFFGRGGGRFFVPQPSPQQGQGTGFVVREDGLIITNNHVVADADVVKVQFDNNSKEQFDAELVGRDPYTDIALIRVKTKRSLPVLKLGNSKDVQVGEWVAAFGNPYGHAHTMTKGIISAIGREIRELNRLPFLQTDASINPGNSGGPLVNSLGYVIGVNTAIDARAQGIGFAIPIDYVKDIVTQLESTGLVKRGYFGIGIQPITPQVASSLGLESLSGVIVSEIRKNGPAAKAGILMYDIVTEINGREIQNEQDLVNTVAGLPIGSKASVKVIRFVNDRKTERSLTLVVDENPDDRPMRRAAAPAPKKLSGQTAPFNMGFKVADLTNELRQEFGIDSEAKGAVIVEIERSSLAAQMGLQPGDLVLDVNRKEVSRAADVLKFLKPGKNILRIQRGLNSIVLAVEF